MMTGPLKQSAQAGEVKLRKSPGSSPVRYGSVELSAL